MPDQPGFEIFKRFYPLITLDQFRFGDPVLVTEVTGLTWPEFTAGAQRMQDEYNSLLEQELEIEHEPDPVIVFGLMAVAFWNGNRQMGRAKVVKAVERIPMSDVEFIPGDEEEADVRPPDLAADGTPPLTTSSASDGSPEVEDLTAIHLVATSDETSPNGSGSHGLPSVPPESLPA